MSLNGGCNLYDQIERLFDTPHIVSAKGSSNEEGEESDENDFIKDTENDFNLVEQTGEPISGNLAKIIKNVICFPIN